MKDKKEKEENVEQTEETEVEPKTVSVSELELEQLRKEVKEYKHKYLQSLADAENARKRLQKDRDEIIQYALRSLISDFLHPIDHMENALKFTEEASSEVKHWATGFQMIMNQFKDVLANNGVKPIEAQGKHFDPHLHEAVEMIETTEHEPGTIVEVSVRGYTIGDKTLRPSRVKVAKAPSEAKEEKVNLE